MDVSIHVNGTARAVPAGCTVAELIEQLELRPEQVAVELNRVLVGKARRATQELQAGDRIELVTLVGGG